MERSLTGMLFLVAAVALSIAAGTWWMQRIIFTPDDTTETAAAILEEPDIRQDLNSVIASFSAPTLETTTTDLGTLLEEVVLTSRPGATVMAPHIEEIHDLVIGNSDRAVVLTGSELIPIVRDERAADVPNITLPIETIGTLDTFRKVFGWMTLITAALGLIILLLGIFTRPERHEVLRGLGELGLALAVAMLLFGYLIPVHFVTAIDNRTWANIAPRLALRTLPVVLGATAIFAAGGLLLIVSSTSGGKRRQWSTPLSATRYRGGRDPGWG